MGSKAKTKRLSVKKETPRATDLIPLPGAFPFLRIIALSLL